MLQHTLFVTVQVEIVEMKESNALPANSMKGSNGLLAKAAALPCHSCGSLSRWPRRASNSDIRRKIDFQAESDESSAHYLTL
jgi:hypothetical protein